MPDPARVRLMGFGSSSLEVEIFAYINESDFNAYLGVREDLNLRVIEIVAASGTGFALPSQTVYLGRDEGLPSERGRHAADEVEPSRRQGRLLFPEFLEEEYAQMSDTPPSPAPGWSPNRS